MRSATGSCAYTRNGANAISATTDATPTHTRIARRRRSVVVPFTRGFRVVARASLCGGDAASGFASWPTTSVPGAFAIVMLGQAAFCCSDARSIDARWRIHQSSLDDVGTTHALATGSTVE